MLMIKATEKIEQFICYNTVEQHLWWKSQKYYEMIKAPTTEIWKTI